MSNIIKLTEWRRPACRAREPMIVVQDCGGHRNIERVVDLTISPAYQVTAVFAGGEVSFSLSIGNTFEDLADRLDHLGEQYSGKPVAVYFKPSRARQPNSALL